MVDLALVECVPRFADLPSGTKAALADAFDEVTVRAGERIISQGECAYELFAILEGTVLVAANIPSSPISLTARARGASRARRPSRRARRRR